MRFALAVKLISFAAPTAITATMTTLRLRGRYALSLIALHRHNHCGNLHKHSGGQGSISLKNQKFSIYIGK